MQNMRIFKFNKLVRDKIVEGIIEAGNHPVYHTLNDKEYIEELKKKLLEEAKEVPQTNKNSDLIEEIADVQEVIDNILEVLNVSKSELTKFQSKKNKERGSFKKRLYIDTVKTKTDSKWTNYYLANPDKYPEVK